MQLRLLDILADPDDPSCWPLELHVISSEMRERTKTPYPHKSTGLYCKFYCFKKKKFLVSDPLGENEQTLSPDEIQKITTLEECQKCMALEVIDGVLYHDFKAKRKWFIIQEGIAVMHGLDNRSQNYEKKFFEKYPEVWDKLNLEWY